MRNLSGRKLARALKQAASFEKGALQMIDYTRGS